MQFLYGLNNYDSIVNHNCKSLRIQKKFKSREQKVTSRMPFRLTVNPMNKNSP